MQLHKSEMQSKIGTVKQDSAGEAQICTSICHQITSQSNITRKPHKNKIDTAGMLCKRHKLSAMDHDQHSASFFIFKTTT